MCGRFEGVDETWVMLHELLGGFAQLPSDVAAEIYAGRELRPTNKYPVLANANDGGYRIMPARWGLIPGFFKGPVKDWKAATFNAKIEEAPDKPTWRGPFRSKHCLVPVASFWEWSGPHPVEAKKKQRFCITRADNHPMVLAGLWDHATTADGPVTSFTILTRAAGGDMSALHDREPVSLDPDQWKPWLDHQPMPELTHPGMAGALRYSPEMRSFA